MWLNPQETAELFTFTEEILNGKLHVLSNDTQQNNYVVKVNNTNTRKRCEICLKLTKKPERFGVFFANFEKLQTFF